ncbi:MAG: hypothetical protein J6Y31_00035 [Bacteroidales bacterium]|nr:hypothetical protein [Bacteroidales bacterium]
MEQLRLSYESPAVIVFTVHSGPLCLSGDGNEGVGTNPPLNDNDFE